jgi:deazaflavin-dependent oxidoreductase (nitroreductase family)
MSDQTRAFRAPPKKMILSLYAHGLAPLLGGMVLLLYTRGRKTGLERVTPLQYELVDGKLYLGSASGLEADWVKNIQACPQVRVRIKDRWFTGQARVVADPVEIADFLALRLERHPRMVGAILKSEGLPARPDRETLVAYARQLALVIVTPDRPIP